MSLSYGREARKIAHHLPIQSFHKIRMPGVGDWIGTIRGQITLCQDGITRVGLERPPG